MVEIGPSIAELISQKRITIADLARKLNVSAQSVHGQLKKANLGSDYIQRVMEATDIQSWEIFRDGSPPDYPSILMDSTPIYISDGYTRDLEKQVRELQAEIIKLLKNRGNQDQLEA